jgi:hypothetical protein
MAGERLVFRRRAEAAEDPFPQRPPGSSDSNGKAKRRMLFLLDCSGSMDRFNGAWVHVSVRVAILSPSISIQD